MPLIVSHFRCDVTPPLGHPLCGGWITPATEIVDRQWANGLILRADEASIVTDKVPRGAQAPVR